MYNVGYSFSTGNAVIRTLKPGTKLVVTGPGTVQIEGKSVADLEPGDRINTKHGPATVVRFTDRFNVEGEIVDALENGVLYVADADPVVRVAPLSAVSVI